MKRLRDLLVDGMLLALPLGAAAYVLYKAIGLLTKLLAPIADLLPEGHWFAIAAVELAAVVVLLLGLLVLGLFARSSPGRRLAATIENVVLSKIPGYVIFKSIVAGFDGDDGDSELRPVLVAFDDNAVLGFITEEAADGGMFTVFVPGAPSTGSGNVVLVPRARVQPLDVPTRRVMRAMKQRGIGVQDLTQAPSPVGSKAPQGKSDIDIQTGKKAASSKGPTS